MTTNRRHTDLIRRIKALDTSTSESAVVGQATGHHLWGLRCGAQDAARRVLITDGVHGDEPAGVEAVIKFLEQSVADYVRHFHFVVIPRVNPSGYEANTRENGSGEDINCFMSNNGVIESMTLRYVIADQQFERTSGWSAYAYFESATHGVLTETPSTAWPLHTRVEAHLLALRLVLDHYTVT